MKPEIHPTYYPNAKIHCACGKIYKIGATKQELRVEICANCHPFYTGEEKLIDTAGRVEKFRARRTKAETAPKKEKKARVKKQAGKSLGAKSLSERGGGPRATPKKPNNIPA